MRLKKLLSTQLELVLLLTSTPPHLVMFFFALHVGHFTLFTTASGDGDTSANSDTNASYSATIAVLAVSLLLNITLATVILIQCLLVLRRKKPKDMLHSSNSETYAEPIKQVDVSTAPNEAYGLHKITKPSEEDTTYEMVK